MPVLSRNRTGKKDDHMVSKFKAVAVECCHVCNVPKVPDERKEWFKCQNQRCEAYNQARASGSYHKAYVQVPEESTAVPDTHASNTAATPINALEDQVLFLRRELESALERNQPNADAVKEYQSQVLRLELEVRSLKYDNERIKLFNDELVKERGNGVLVPGPDLKALQAENQRLRDAELDLIEQRQKAWDENKGLREALESIVADFPDTRAGMTAADALKETR